MRKTVFFNSIFFLALVLLSCSNGKNQLLKDIKAKEKIVSESIDDVFDKSTAESLRNDYIDFSERFQEDSLAPVFLHKAAELAINLNMPQEAVSTIDTLINRYPDYEFLPDAWFFKGFIQETYLNDQGAAKNTYMSFIQRFPKHEMAPQVQFSLENIGKSADELLEEFMRKNQQTDTLSILPDTSK